jgi:hypothetical protein
MDTITKITNKIKEYTESREFTRIGKTVIVILLMTISFTFGKLSSRAGDSTVLDPVSIYLPDGTVYSGNLDSTRNEPLSAYILGGATDAIRLANGPSTAERVSMAENDPNTGQITSSADTSSSTDQPEAIFGSKNGSTYYIPGCKSGNRVKPENRVYFESETDAEDQGYSRSKLCK